MRTMYDTVTPADIPTSAPHVDLIAAYISGPYRDSYPAARARFPHAVLVSIATQAQYDAQVLDVERFDATPDEVPAWVVRQRRRGQIPTVYCNVSTWPAVRHACAAAGVALPLWDAARWDGRPVLEPGSIATQYADSKIVGHHWDMSVVADFWPGVDHPRRRPVPPPPPRPRPASSHVVRAGDTLTSIAKGWRCSLRSVKAANQHAGHPAGNFDVIWPGDVIHHP